MKKILMLSLIFVLFFTISSIYATDVNETVVANENQDIINIENNDLSSIEEENINKINSIDQTEEYKSAGTFTDLARAIGYTESELNLTRDYMYSENDSQYQRGIDLDYKITINGNGHIINGNGQARVFNIDANYVVLKNISFVNCSATFDSNDCSGGAIFFSGCNGRIENCTFMKCFVTGNGGAIRQINRNSWELNIVNCTFIDNRALQYGGAIYQRYDSSCQVTNCSFISNTAFNGGATCQASVSDSFFYNNKATEKGGAMCW